MNQITIPPKTVLIVKANNLQNKIKKFKKENLSFISKEDRDIIIFKIINDGCSILTNILGYLYEDNKSEFLIGILWYLELSEEDDINPIKCIDQWELYNQELKNNFINFIYSNSHKNPFFSSILFIRQLVIDEETKNIQDSIINLYLDLFQTLINIDNNISEQEKKAYNIFQEFLEFNYNQNVSDNNEIEKSINSQQNQNELSNIIEELDNLIGLNDIKNEVKSLIKFVQINRLRKIKNLPTISISLHSVFYGSPGTGKTTIARLLAQAYKSLGILKEGHLVETERSQLVAGYVGQTAIKTKEILETSLDGVLFIDEAYSLNSKDEFGKEAIDTILKYMEDKRDRLIVIVAGYENEMNGFINSNPGLQSRFNKFFYFPNYSENELLEILKRLLIKNQFIFSKEIEFQLKKIIIQKISEDGVNFGNARFIRNLYEKVIQNQFLRVSETANENELCTIELEDIERL